MNDKQRKVNIDYLNEIYVENTSKLYKITVEKLL